MQKLQKSMKMPRGMKTLKNGLSIKRDGHNCFSRKCGVVARTLKRYSGGPRFDSQIERFSIAANMILSIN